MQLNGEDRVMILLRESLMQSSGTITPASGVSKLQSGDALLKNAVSKDGTKMNFNGVTKERDAFLQNQFKQGHFKDFNKLFKQEDANRLPGLVGPNIPAGAPIRKKYGPGAEKKVRREELDENGNPIKKDAADGKHVDQRGEKVKYKSLL